MRNFPIIVLGWLTPDIIKRCLASVNGLSGVNPQIYFAENHSVNSQDIEELIAKTPNIKGHIRMKENHGASVWKIILDHFFQNIDEEFVTITDGDYIFDVEAMEKQYELFDKYDDIGIISQRRSLLGMDKRMKWMVLGGYASSNREDERNYKISQSRRSTFNGMSLTTARKKDWQAFIDCVNNRHISFETWSICQPGGQPEYRPPVFWDTDLYPFFETVLNKRSFVIEETPSYHITDEYENDTESEYYKEKHRYGYRASWEAYLNDLEYYHSKSYPDGTLKYEIII